MEAQLVRSSGSQEGSSFGALARLKELVFLKVPMHKPTEECLEAGVISITQPSPLSHSVSITTKATSVSSFQVADNSTKKIFDVVEPANATHQSICVGDDCFAMPTVPLTDETRNQWENDIRPRLQHEAREMLGRSCLLEFCIVRDKLGKMGPCILVIWWDESTSDVSQTPLRTKRKIQKKVRKFQSLRGCRFPVKVVIDRVRLLGQTPFVDGVCLMVAIKHPKNYREAIHSAQIIHARDRTELCTLGGLLRVDGQIYGLTVAHPFLNHETRATGLQSSESWPHGSAKPINDKIIQQNKQTTISELSQDNSDSDGSDNQNSEEDAGQLFNKFEDVVIKTSRHKSPSSSEMQPKHTHASMTTEQVYSGETSPSDKDDEYLAANVLHISDANNSRSSYVTDWALLGFKDLQSCSSGDQSYKEESGSTLVPAASCQIVPGYQVKICMMGATFVTGHIGQTNIELELAGLRLHVTQIVLSEVLKPGNSGCWVIDGTTVFGQLVAARTLAPIAYMVAMEGIVQDIAQRFDAREVALLELANHFRPNTATSISQNAINTAQHKIFNSQQAIQPVITERDDIDRCNNSEQRSSPQMQGDHTLPQKSSNGNIGLSTHSIPSSPKTMSVPLKQPLRRAPMFRRLAITKMRSFHSKSLKDPEGRQDDYNSLELGSIHRTPELPAPESNRKAPLIERCSRTETTPMTLITPRRRLGVGLDNIVMFQPDSDISWHRTRKDNIPMSTDVLQGSQGKKLKESCQDLAQARNSIICAHSTNMSDIAEVLPSSIDPYYSIDPSRLAIQRDGLHKRSYFFPREADAPNWRPDCTQSPYPVVLCCFAFVIAAVQEGFCQVSLRLEKGHGDIDLFKVDSNLAFVLWKYIPSLVVVSYAVFFAIIDYEIRRLEPYFQLAQPGGNTVESCLNLDYVSVPQYVIPFKAMTLKQSIVMFSSIGNMLAAIVAPMLLVVSIKVSEIDNELCQTQQNCDTDTKPIAVRIRPVWSRLSTTVYILLGVITAIVTYSHGKRKSGLLHDPKGIAAIASMATNSSVLEDFDRCDLFSIRDIDRTLARRKFVLHKASIWQGEYNSPKQEKPMPRTLYKRQFHRIHHSVRLYYGRIEQAIVGRRAHTANVRLRDTVLLSAFLALGSIMVPIVSLTRVSTLLMNAPWLPILIATILRLLWSYFDANVRLFEPHYQLKKGSAKPEDCLTLDYSAMTYATVPVVALFKRHFLVAFVSICSMLLNLFCVLSGSLAFGVRYSIIAPEAKASLANVARVSNAVSASIAIAISVIVVWAMAWIYYRYRKPFLPRKPSTIASVLASIHASRMLDDFIGTERLTNHEMESKLRRAGKRYSFGLHHERGNEPHWGIDDGERKSQYHYSKVCISETVPRLVDEETYSSRFDASRTTDTEFVETNWGFGTEGLKKGKSPTDRLFGF